MNKKVIVIIVNYRQTLVTVKCVESVLTSDYDNFRIILIDNGPEQNEHKKLLDELIIYDRVTVHKIDNNVGYVGGVNYGLEVASKEGSDYYLIMNNDTIIDKYAISFLVSTGEKFEENAIISGKIYHLDQPNKIQYTGGLLKNKKYLTMHNPGEDEIDNGQCDIEEQRDMLDDIMWLLPNKIYIQIGPYPACYFIYAEQSDYALQAVSKGFKLIYSPKAIIWHKGSITSGDGNRFSPTANFWRKKSIIIFLYRNLKRRYFCFYLFKTFTKYFTRHVLNLLKLRREGDKKSDYAALVGICYGIKWIFNKVPDHGYNPFLKLK